MEDGKKITNSAAISAIQNKKIYNAKVITKDGLEKMFGLWGTDGAGRKMKNISILIVQHYSMVVLDFFDAKNPEK